MKRSILTVVLALAALVSKPGQADWPKVWNCTEMYDSDKMQLTALSPRHGTVHINDLEIQADYKIDGISRVWFWGSYRISLSGNEAEYSTEKWSGFFLAESHWDCEPAQPNSPKGRVIEEIKVEPDLPKEKVTEEIEVELDPIFPSIYPKKWICADGVLILYADPEDELGMIILDDITHMTGYSTKGLSRRWDRGRGEIKDEPEIYRYGVILERASGLLGTVVQAGYFDFVMADEDGMAVPQSTFWDCKQMEPTTDE